MRKIRKTSKTAGGVGKIYVKFGETIDLKKYVERRRLASPTIPKFTKMALELTNHLMLTQEEESPVLLTNILATLLQQE